MAEASLCEAKEALIDIESAGHRAEGVLTNVRRLFSDSEQDLQGVDVNGLVLEALQLLREQIEAHGVATTTELTPELPAVSGHRVQLQQVILNLVNNAMDAMTLGNVSRRTLQVRTKTHGAGAIVIEVQNSGPGIEPEHLDTIFEPFVTTKPNGTGLGLAICSAIIASHRGRIIATSDGKNGALFQIVLPFRRPSTDTDHAG